MCKLQDASETFYRPLLSSICARTHRSRENIHPQQHSLSCPLCVFDSSLSATPYLELSLSIFSARPVINERHADREGESDGQEDEELRQMKSMSGALMPLQTSERLI